jgi:hypothetical protein
MSIEHIDTLIAFALVMLLLSLLITALLEAINVALMRRGRNLIWGVQRVLIQMGVDDADAKRLAKAILRHPALSASGKVYASAIRVDELARLASDVLANGDGKGGERIVLNALVRAKLDNAAAGLASGAEGTIGASAVAAAPALADLALQELAARAPGAPVNVEELRSRFSNEMRRHVDQATRAAAEAALELGAWFNLVMDRTTERFVSWTRTWTVVLAFGLAGLFHIDSLALLKQLSTDAELRAALVEGAGATLADAEKIQLELGAGRAVASESLAAVRKELEAAADSKLKALAAHLPEPPSDLRTPGQAEAWLADHVADEAARDAIHERFEEENGRRLDERLAKVRAVGSELAGKLASTGLDLFPPPEDWGLRYRDPATGGIDWRHVLGVAITGVLLSLGAPFWFNTLRNLSNLKPMVARRVEKETQQAAEAARAGESG